MNKLPLEDCMAAIIDYRGKTPRKTSVGIPLITAKIVKNGRIEQPEEFIDPLEYDEWMRRGLPQIGDVVITTEAPLGEVAQLSDSHIALAQRLILLRGKPGLLDNTYLKYLLMSDGMQEQLGSRASGTTVVGIKQSELRKVHLSLPAIDQQESIAGVLGSLDDKIEQNRRTGRALEGLARAVFKAWFVDFEPVKAKAAGQTSFPGMPAAAFASLPNRFVDSELGPAPQGWEVRRLQDVMTLHYGKALNKTKRQPGQVPVYGSGGVNGTHNESLVAGPGVIVGRKGSVGTLYWENQDFFPIDTTFYVEPVAELGLHYLFEQLQTLGLETMNTDAAVPGLNRDNAYRLEVVVPSSDVSRYFNQYAKSLRDLISHATAESAKLAALRDYLLPRLLSGRVRVNGPTSSSGGVP